MNVIETDRLILGRAGSRTGEARGDADGAWTLPSTPQMKDYVVVLEANN
jgi:hypothetical protein